VNKNRVYLVQTDTTVGFLSSNDKKLSSIKQRPSTQKMIQVVDSFSTLKQLVRIPKKFRKTVRNSSQATFIYPNENSYRVVDTNSQHHSFINKFGIMYSTSANITKQKFDKSYAQDKCDVWVEDNNAYSETSPSHIYKISKTNISKLR